MEIPKQTERELLAGLPPSALFDLARNGSARLSARKTAVAILIGQNDPRAHNPELSELVYAVAAETLGSAESFPNEKPVVQETFPSAGPFRASVTTETMFHDGDPNQEFLDRGTKPRLPRQPIVSVDVPALEPFDPEK